MWDTVCRWAGAYRWVGASASATPGSLWSRWPQCRVTAELAVRLVAVGRRPQAALRPRSYWLWPPDRPNAPKAVCQLRSWPSPLFASGYVTVMDSGNVSYARLLVHPAVPFAFGAGTEFLEGSFHVLYSLSGPARFLEMESEGCQQPDYSRFGRRLRQPCRLYKWGRSRDGHERQYAHLC